MILLLFTADNNIKLQTEINFCDITNEIYLNKKRDFPDTPYPQIIDKISKIDDKVVERFLIENSDKFKNYNFGKYFSENFHDKSYFFSCKTIKYKVFKNEEKKLKKNLQKLNLTKYILYYEPIFNSTNTQFILCYKEIKSDLSTSFRLILYDFSNGIALYRETLLIST